MPKIESVQLNPIEAAVGYTILLNAWAWMEAKGDTQAAAVLKLLKGRLKREADQTAIAAIDGYMKWHRMDMLKAWREDAEYQAKENGWQRDRLVDRVDRFLGWGLVDQCFEGGNLVDGPDGPHLLTQHNKEKRMNIMTPEQAEQILTELRDMKRYLAKIAGEDPDAPEACRKKTCSYFQHYLAYGPADLTHEGYHAAEKAGQAHFENCSRCNRGEMCSICTGYETRLRA